MPPVALNFLVREGLVAHIRHWHCACDLHSILQLQVLVASSLLGPKWVRPGLCLDGDNLHEHVLRHRVPISVGRHTTVCHAHNGARQPFAFKKQLVMHALQLRSAELDCTQLVVVCFLLSLLLLFILVSHLCALAFPAWLTRLQVILVVGLTPEIRHTLIVCFTLLLHLLLLLPIPAAGLLLLFLPRSLLLRLLALRLVHAATLTAPASFGLFLPFPGCLQALNGRLLFVLSLLLPAAHTLVARSRLVLLVLLLLCAPRTLQQLLTLSCFVTLLCTVRQNHLTLKLCHAHELATIRGINE
mmetsp:Transcript_23160/g.64010  ORF Transcript_23160/g.64010 Transcript_23160/m.64010 type:complete len:300 (-) Transcript_23160:308-1207(-)